MKRLYRSAETFVRDQNGGLEEMSMMGGFVEDVAVPVAEELLYFARVVGGGTKRVGHSLTDGTIACLREPNENLRQAYGTRAGLWTGVKIAIEAMVCYASLC